MLTNIAKLLIFSSLWVFGIANAQEIGKLPFKNFSHSDYFGHFQNWAVIQDHRGLMYVANNTGVLEYDGQKWAKISINNAVARALDTDEAGRIWVGAQDELGYLAADSSGKMAYYSLLHLLSDLDKPIGLVRQVYATKQGVYFSTNSIIIRIKGNTIDKWHPKTYFHRTYRVEDQIYSVQPDVGLTILKGDTMSLISGGEQFAKTRIYTMLPYDKGRILVGTQSDGFYLLKLSNIEGSKNPSVPVLDPFLTSNDKFFKDNWVYNGIRLPNGWFAIATYRGGAVVIDEKGKIVQFIGRDQGIQDETVWHISHDNQENIWLALNNGISYSALISPTTSWDASSGLQGVIQSVQRYKGKLYLSSNAGVFFLQEKGFARVDGILNLSWDIVKVTSSDGATKALVATGDGIFQIEDGKARMIQNGNEPAFKILQSVFNKDLIYLGLYDGLGIAAYRNGRWEYIGKIEGINDRIYTLTEDHQGNIWYSARFKYIARLKISKPFSLQFDKLDTFSDLPHNPELDEDTKLLLLEKQIKLSTEKGLAFFNPDSQKFEPDFSLGTEFADGSTGIRLLGLDSFYNLWFESSKHIHSRSIERAILSPEGSFIRLPSELNEIPKGSFYCVYTEDNGVVWIAGADGLYRFDPSIDKRGRQIPRVLIRRVLKAQNQPIFEGSYPQKCPDGYFNCTGLVQQNENGIKLSHSENSIAFHFTSPFFGQEERIMYSFMLDGFDEDWSDWTLVNRKEYTNLPHGSYRFNVKALSIYEVESPIASFNFSVDRPWYNHPLVYFGSFVILIIIISAIVAIRTRMLKASNVRLHKLVEERTSEILMQQRDILEKNEELMQQKDEIEVQRHELELQNKHTKESIQYALTIQQAILPEKRIFNLYFENFIIFKPKDVVSGDFYWFSHIPIKNGISAKEIIAVVDCTGHGVPGAFMSMIGSRMLSEIVIEREIHSPEIILIELNKMLNSVLHQDSSDNFDGMDVAICTIEKKLSNTYTVSFAGANRPFSYFKKDTLTITTLRGSRKHIGGLIPDIDQEFQIHQVDLEAGDCLFLYTDGLTDQNNADNKKFSTGRFETLLMTNIEKPMEQIGEILNNSFEGFKGTCLQRDDVTVLGLRLL